LVCEQHSDTIERPSKVEVTVKFEYKMNIIIFTKSHPNIKSYNGVRGGERYKWSDSSV